MNEFFINQKAVVDMLLVALMGILTYLGKNALKRLEHLEKDTLRKADLELLRVQLRGEHEENRNTMDDIRNDVTDLGSNLSTRIDNLFNQLLAAKQGK